jgi:hypothetical protein
MTNITETQWNRTIDAGLGVFVRRIPGDRIDDSYEGDLAAVEAAEQMPADHKDLLQRSKVAREAVIDAYGRSSRNSCGKSALLMAAALQYNMWLAAKTILEKHQPSVQVAALVLEAVTK